jgi:hypothetical protein
VENRISGLEYKVNVIEIVDEYIENNMKKYQRNMKANL